MHFDPFEKSLSHRFSTLNDQPVSVPNEVNETVASIWPEDLRDSKVKQERNSLRLRRFLPFLRAGKVKKRLLATKTAIAVRKAGHCSIERRKKLYPSCFGIESVKEFRLS